MMHIYTSGRIEDLAARLASVLAADPLDPMQSEWVAVPSDAMRRWLALDLARHLGADEPGRQDGIAAHIEFPFPGSLRQRVLDARRGADQPDPWQVDRLVWSVLATMEQHRADPTLAALNTLPPGASRYGQARRVADLFDRYHVHRPSMIRSWSIGDDVDSSGRAMAQHYAWQPHLWRLLRTTIGEASPLKFMPGLLEELTGGTFLLDLPDRLSLFGLTSLPGGSDFLQLSQALAGSREIHLFLLEPAALGPDVLDRWQRATSDSGFFLRSDESADEGIHHPLLRTWGRLQRETSLLLAAAEDRGMPRPEDVAPAGGEEPVRTLLQRLQSDIRGNRAPTADHRLEPNDRSIQVHACYGMTRQVEVLRDSILHLLADPTLDLSEDDILVVSPVLARSASLIEAVFGPSISTGSTPAAAGRPEGAPGLRYRIADRSVRDFNQVLSSMSELIALIGGRFEASVVLDFIALLPVRTRFGLTDDDVAQTNEWVGAANVRWGLDPLQRDRLGVPASIQTNTWRQALDRLLLGSAVFDTDVGLAVGDMPVLGVEGSDVDTLGRVAELVRRLGDLAEEARHPRPIREWLSLLRNAAMELFDMPDELQWQMGALWSLLDDVGESVPPVETGVQSDLPFGDLRRVFGDRLDAVPGRPDFFRGGITISSLTPLRGIPFRVVCLLGMDEGAFGNRTVDGDDLAVMTPALGDPDPRAEVRLSILEAVLAAQDRLILFRDGYDVRTNQEVKPAVLVQELHDVVTAMVHTDDAPSPADHIEIQHPRQSFDERCFIPGTLGEPGPWGFDPTSLAGALAARRRVLAPRPFLSSPLPSFLNDTIDFADLQRFLRNPVRWFMEQGLSARLVREEGSMSDRLPVNLDSLERWNVGDRLLRALLRGVPFEAWARSERHRGTLPNHALGESVIADLGNDVPALIAAAESRGFSVHAGGTLPIDLTLPDGSRLVGSVPNHFSEPDRGPVRISFSKAKPRDRVAASVDLLALVAMDPASSWRSLVINRSEKGPDVQDLVPLDHKGQSARALSALHVVVDCYRRGSREPIPLFPTCSRLVASNKPGAPGWNSYAGRGDGDDSAVLLAFGGHDFHSLMEIPARADDPSGRGNRMERYARYLFDALDQAVDTQ